ncbi:hypothetical protein HYU22_04725 [Candidatus Woesearchaeota archaeon]|nr:hypothetical protein [Candidatus Woesearchaeota archaeon]
MAKTALVGFHDETLAELTRRILQRVGYRVEMAETTEQMLALSRRSSYDLYLMDLNFRAAAGDITPAEQVYRILQEQGRGNRFYGLSGSVDVVQNARQAGIPARDKTDLDAIMRGELN